MKRFKSSYSKCMALSTCLLLALLAFAICTIVDNLLTMPIGSFSFILALMVLCFILASLFYAFLSQIRYVCLTEDSVVIKKMFGRIFISRADILRVCYKKSLLYDVRLCGISGLFGHIGLFRNSKSGRYYACVNNGSAMLEIKTIDKCYVISCDDYMQVLNILSVSDSYKVLKTTEKSFVPQ